MACFFRTLAIWVAVLGVNGCVTTANDPNELEITWRSGLIAFPASLSKAGTPCIGEIGETRQGVACWDMLDKSKKHPVIIFLHGCGGEPYDGTRFYQKYNAVVIAPSSMNRPSRRAVGSVWGPICRLTDGYSAPTEIDDMRRAEAGYALDKLHKLPWVDTSRIILGGFSQGGVATAMLDAEGYAAKIIFGWSCWSNNIRYHGVRGAKKPVLSIQGKEDRYTKNTYRDGHHCGEFIKDWPGSKWLYLDGVGHSIFQADATRPATDAFLAQFHITRE